MAKRAGVKAKAVASLAEADAIATIAVKDLKAARSFYERTMGLEVESTEEDQALEFRSGGSRLYVYVSQFAGTNRATTATWKVDDVDEVVRELKAKGIGFERYEMPDARHEGDVHVFGEARAAWFKDPDGNILAVFSR